MQQHYTGCRDAFWALLFVAHLVTMCCLALFRGLPELHIAAQTADAAAADPAWADGGDDYFHYHGSADLDRSGNVIGGGDGDGGLEAAHDRDTGSSLDPHHRGRDSGELMTTGSVLVAVISLALASVRS